MVELGSESRREPFFESPTQPTADALDAFEVKVQSIAKRVTSKQYKTAQAIVNEHYRQNSSKENLIEQICVLMAESFKDGINLALETYQLKA